MKLFLSYLLKKSCHSWLWILDAFNSSIKLKNSIQITKYMSRFWRFNIVLFVEYECFKLGWERLFVQPFIWQRNCKKRDLFNGSFSSQLGAVVGSVMASVMTLIQWSNLMWDVCTKSNIDQNFNLFISKSRRYLKQEKNVVAACSISNKKIWHEDMENFWTHISYLVAMKVMYLTSLL